MSISDYYKYGEKVPFRTAEGGHIRILKFSRPSAQLYQALTFWCRPTRRLLSPYTRADLSAEYDVLLGK